jgi:ferredoxin
MPTPRIALAFFSATHVTKLICEAIQRGLTRRGVEARLFDITPFAARQTPLPVGDFDGFVFGYPVFADFPPTVVNDWLASLRGDGKPCALAVTYGGRAVGHAHYHGLALLRDAGFRVLFTAEFLGRHSFNVAGWHLLPGRPDQRDFAVADEFARLLLEHATPGSPATLSLQKPPGYDEALASLRNKQRGPDRGPCNPVRTVECSRCGTCVEECPTQAIDLETGMSDPRLCIECMHCVYLCPEKALKVDDHVGAIYPMFLQRFQLTEELAEQKQSRIITTAAEAVA